MEQVINRFANAPRASAALDWAVLVLGAAALCVALVGTTVNYLAETDAPSTDPASITANA